MRRGRARSMGWSAAAAVLLLVSIAVRATAQQLPAQLTDLEFDIVGVRLVPSPTALTVPKGIPTRVNADLVVPAGAGADVAQAVATLADGAFVEAELRGPGIPPIPIRVDAGQPLPIPALALAGDYFLDRIRLVKDGEVVLDATPPTVPIKVIAEILVTSVSSRPLSIDEIREKGIVIDDTSFSAFEFQLALNVDGVPFTIKAPIAFPKRDGEGFRGGTAENLIQLAQLNQDLLRLAEVDLPPQLERPGLNFSIAAIPFVPGGSDAGGGLPFGVPPIAGLVLTAGDVAFLNQFFSMKLIVANVAPDGSNLVLRDIEGEITLPTGLDRVPGASFQNPGDDPLRLARIEGIGQVPVLPLLTAGADGAPGTADDDPRIRPQETSQAEFLVEGLLEGNHSVDFEIRAVLDGLPSGPVELVGNAVGAVLVRNPTFSITLSQPGTVRAFEPYDLWAVVTNTSLQPANLVSLNLDANSSSGTLLAPGQEPSVVLDTIPPGEAREARFRMLSQRTGEVTFGVFNSEPGLTGSFQLRTGVGERDVPLSPNAIVLPASTRLLPDALIAAAQRVLGQALSIATAPTLPPGVLWLPRRTVVARALDLAEAGQRVEFGESLERVVRDLLLDWLGAREADPGFDQLLRETQAGAAFAGAVGSILEQARAGVASLELLRRFGESTVARDGYLAAIVGDGAGPAPVELRVLDSEDRAVGALGRALPYADRFPLAQGAVERSDLDVVARLVSPSYVVEVEGTDAGAFDLGVLLPSAPGVLALLRYAGVSIQRGDVARVVVSLTGPNTFALRIDRGGDGSIDETRAAVIESIVERAPAILTVRQIRSSFGFGERSGGRDPANYGLIVGVLFDKPVTEASAETVANYAIETNAVLGGALQPSGRLLYLILQKPLGVLVPRSLTARDVADVRGNRLQEITLPIEMIWDDGARVFGQLRSADGQGVGNAVLSLYVICGQAGFQLGTVRTDPDGGFDFDHVKRLSCGGVVIFAQHPDTLDFTTARAFIRAPGQLLRVNPTFLGRGTVRGRVLEPDGVTPVAGALVQLWGAELDHDPHAMNANSAGEFVFQNVLVGRFQLRSANARSEIGTAAGDLPTAGAEVEVDVVVAPRVGAPGRLIGRVFRSDGATPAEALRVLVGSLRGGLREMEVFDESTSDAAGGFAFENLPARTFSLVALDPASGEIGYSQVLVEDGLTTSANVVLQATGAVEGVVRDAQGNVVAGALVAGGTALGTSDANGFFTIEGVPPGERVIEAGNPLNRRRGRATVTVLAGRTSSVAIALEARATLVGRVLDANGNPVPRATVRLPTPDGYRFVFANNGGFYRFPEIELASHLVQAPGPDQRTLIEFMLREGIPVESAFTAIPPDMPADLGGSAPPISQSGDAAAIAAAYAAALNTASQAFVDSSTRFENELPVNTAGGFGWTRVELFQDSVTVSADVRYLAQGSVSGTTVDANDAPVAAAVQILALGVDGNGMPRTREFGRVNTPLGSGAFSFGPIARFELETFQRTGIRSGNVALTALQPFSPAVASYQNQLNANNPNLSGILLRFPALGDTNGTLSGRVLLPDGVTPAPANTEVRISFGDLTVRTDAEGRFANVFPIPESVYTLTALEPVSGLRGQTFARVPPGGNVEVEIRLLGLGAVSVEVQRPTGQVVPNARVELVRAGFPGDTAEGDTGPDGRVRFANLTEGAFGVRVFELGTGLAGAASGTVARDAEVAVVAVVQPSGRVTGSFVTAQAAAPIANAQIELSHIEGLRAYATTGADGRFDLDAIPVGSFQIEASDPLTGRFGRASGRIRIEGDQTDVTVVQGARGSVIGAVLNSDGVTPIQGASVVARIAGGAGIWVTAGPGGSFRFDGVPEGPFTLEAVDPLTRFRGEAAGEVRFEGDTAQADVLIEGYGALRVLVVDTDGVTPVGNAEVRITTAFVGGQAAGEQSRTGTVDPSGSVEFERLPLHIYELRATSLAEPHNGVTQRFALDTPAPFGTCLADTTRVCRDDSECAGADSCDTPATDVTLRLRGVGEVEVLVVEPAGGAPVASARVTLRASASLAGEPGGRPFADTFLGFTDASGRVTLLDVPVGAFDVSGESGPLGGVAMGVVGTPGEQVAVSITLGESATLRGRVLLPDGMTLAAETFVTLAFASQSGLSTGVVQVTTGLDGSFEFAGIPLGDFTLAAFEPVSRGVRSVRGTLDFGGQVLDLGDLVLDNTSPRVAAILPADGATRVPVDAVIELQFNEPLDPQTLNATPGSANVFLQTGTVTVPVLLALSDGNRRATLTPLAPLESSTLYSVAILGVPLGPRDAEGLSLLDPFAASFTAADVIPPTLVSRTPLAGERQVLPEAVVRLQLSEAIAPGFGLRLRDDAGALVDGEVATALGETVAIFTPRNFLLPNRRYSVELSAVTDVAANPLVGGDVSFDFFSVDTIPPQIAALALAGTPSLRAGTLAQVVPQLAATDVVRVEYSVDGAPRVTSVAPFALDLVLPGGAAAVDVRAAAVDPVGNRGLEARLLIPITPNTPPLVTAFTSSCSGSVRQGAGCSFQVSASDDSALREVVFSAQGAANASQTQAFAPGTASGTLFFSLTIPTDAPTGGSVLVRAVPRDDAAVPGAAAELSLDVSDGVRPVVAITSPVAGAQVLPGQTIDVRVSASDDIGLAEIALDCTPILPGCGARPFLPPVAGSAETFTLTIPAGAVAPYSVALVATARDTAGNVRATTPRALALVDLVAPELQALTPLSGSTRVRQGTTVSIRAAASDNVGVGGVEFSVDELPGAGQSVAVIPAVRDALADWNLAVPAGLVDGSALTVRARARDARALASADRTLVLAVGDLSAPMLSVASPAEGAAFAPGSGITLELSAIDDVAVSRLAFTASGVASGSGARDFAPAVTPVSESFAFVIPASAPPGEILFSVVATDTAGRATSVERRVTVLDTTAPSVSITSPAAGARVDPRTPLVVTVTASDPGGVAEIELGALLQTFAPPQADVTASFALPFDPLPVTAGQRTLVAIARDAAGNAGTSPPVVVNVQDVVAPVVSSVDPPAAAVDVPLESNVVVRFSEPLDPATLSVASARLEVGGSPVPLALELTAGNSVLTLDPDAFLPQLASVTLRLDATLTDAGGNALAPFASSFTTESADATGPRVQSISPADGALGVSVGTSILVTFDEPIAPSTLTAQSLAVTANGQPVAGTLVVENGDRSVRFTPDDDLPLAAAIETALSSAIQDVFGNALTDAAGAPLTAPLRFACTTGSFELTSPDDGGVVLEQSDLVLEARASAVLGVASVVFTVNGAALPAIAGPSFQVLYRTPAASDVAALAIEASARDASGVEIARDTANVSVVRGLRISPRVLGVAPAGTAEIALAISSPLPGDLAVTLAAVDPAIVGAPAGVVIPAGAVEARATLTGVASGATTVVAVSALGSDGVVVAVSVPESGLTIDALARSPAIQVAPFASAGSVLLPVGALVTIDVPLLTTPAAADTQVSVFSTNPTVAGASALVPQGSMLARVAISGGAAGEAELTLRAGAAGRSLSVFVGAAPADRIPAIVAAPVGLAVRGFGSAGTAIVPVGGSAVLEVVLLAANAPAPIAVQISSSDPAIAMVLGPVVIPQGSRAATLTVTTGSAGMAELVLRAGAEGRSLTIVVGAASPDALPAVVARPVGIAIRGLPSAGTAIVPVGQSPTLTIDLLAFDAGAPTPVTVTSSDAAVADVIGPLVIPAGSRRLSFTLATGVAGSAQLSFRAGLEGRTLDVIVGAAPPDRVPAIIAPPIGIAVRGLASETAVVMPALATRIVTLDLLATPAAADTPFSVTSTDPAVAAVTAPVSVPAGSRRADVTITAGAAGTARLVLRAGAVGRTLDVFVDSAPADRTPAVAAPPVCIEIGTSPVRCAGSP